VIRIFEGKKKDQRLIKR